MTWILPFRRKRTHRKQGKSQTEPLRNVRQAHSSTLARIGALTEGRCLRLHVILPGYESVRSTGVAFKHVELDADGSICVVIDRSNYGALFTTTDLSSVVENI